MLLDAQTIAFLRRGIRRGVNEAWKEGRIGVTLLLLTAAMTLLQLLLVVFLGVQSAHSLIVSRGDLYVEVLPKAQDQHIQEMYAAMRELPYVHAVEYVPSEKAYEREKLRNPDLIAVLDEYKLANPFPDTFSVTLTTLASYEEFARFIGEERWAQTVDPSFLSAVTTQEKDVRHLLRITGAVRASVLLLFFLSAAIVLFIMVEVIKRRAQRYHEQLALESLMGAMPGDILVPFVAQISALALAALAAGTVAALLCLLALPVFVPTLAREAVFLDLRSEMIILLAWLFPLLLILEIILVPVLASAAAFVGVRPQRLWPIFALSSSLGATVGKPSPR